MKIISHRELIESTSYCIEFRVCGDSSSFRYSFPCDALENIAPLKPAGQENYDRCVKGFDERTGETLVRIAGIDERKHSYWRAAVGKCVCGQNVHLEAFTNTCDCGRDYNSSGQELAVREQWGEETGEHWTECI